jgi:HSP20 family protein
MKVLHTLIIITEGNIMMNFITPWERNTMSLFDNFEKDLFSLNRLHEFKTDIKDEGDKYVIESELPGIPKEDVKVDINGDTLTISAEHKETKEEKDGKKYIRRERSFGSYTRSFDISGVASDAISADYKDGVLTLTLPKKSPETPAARRLEIK